ncbi:unnamed protein product [Phaedon cochleariae]|uniref:PHD-type domain-containing protein n=1 Tax=Phaedon cochleariae TaxID=80249 RepID=A0A9N9SLF3_PHACE|nr:unnamed protein product [Phaedon cochleariae]
MPEVCGFCSSQVSRTNPGLKCQGRCSKYYHSKCAKLPPGFNDLPADSGILWLCKQCISQPQAKTTDIEGPPPFVKELMMEMDLMHNDMNDMKKQQDEVFKSLNFYGDKLDEFHKQMEDVRKYLHQIDNLKEEVAVVKNECTSLKAELEYMQQLSRNNNIEICGVVERNGENLINVVQNISNVVGFDFRSQDIDNIHRVRHFSNNSNPKMPKNIVVKFTTGAKKAECMDAIRKGENKKSQLPNNEFPVYVNENFSPYYKALFRISREFCRLKGYKLCKLR